MHAEPMSAEPIRDPVSRIARVFDSQLVDLENRVDWLDRKASSLSQYCEYPLKAGLGYRGARGSRDGADPSIILDLGKSVPIDAIYLVPTQRDYFNDYGIFPKRFTLDLSDQADFSQRTILYTSGTIQYPTPDRIPVSFKPSDTARNTARYVRLTVQEGYNRGAIDLFGLAEFFVISNGDPVSFGATVTTIGSLDVTGIWYPEALIDGRTTLGIWQHGIRAEDHSDDVVHLFNDEEITTWTLSLDTTGPLDRIVLFPYQMSSSFEGSVFPESFEISLLQENGTSSGTVLKWENSMPGASHMTPLVIPLHGRSAKTMVLTAIRPSMMGNRKIHALSEIEVWSRGQNLAKGLPITRSHDGQTSEVTSLTDGFSSEKRIFTIATWLNQLCERGSIEQELKSLRPTYQKMAANSELNAAWGSAVILGLTFLIPVFIVERRRMMSKEQLTHIRKRIASDLHDDIGSNLGSISLIARTARKDLARLNGPEEIDLDLLEVESIARESSLAMRDIVWLLERRQDSVGDLVIRMRETAGRLLREISFTLECGSNRTTAKLSLDAKRHLFLFYKEAIHNILKHSQATRVSIRLWDEHDKLALEVLDNGIGIPLIEGKSPAAVRKLEDRANALRGILQIESSKETGTCIRLLVKRSHLNNQAATS
jgi:signal transduction histidine kinase